MEETSWKMNNLVNDNKKRYKNEHKNKKCLTDPLKFLYSEPPDIGLDTRFFVEGFETNTKIPNVNVRQVDLPQGTASMKPPTNSTGVRLETNIPKNNLINQLDPENIKKKSSFSLGALGAITTDVSGVSDISFGNMGINIFGALVNKKNKDYADHELIDDITKNKIGFFSSLKIGGCIGGPSGKQVNGSSNDASKLKDKSTSNDKIITGQINSAVTDISKEMTENPIFQFIKENLKYIEYPFIYFRWLEKKIGIKLYEGLAKIQNVKLLDKNQTDTEIRFVNSIISKIFSLIITIFVTYNWFFLMFYQDNNERIIGWNISGKNLRKISPFLNFALEFILYPLECLNWLMLYVLPETMKRVFVTNDLIFLVMYVTIYKIMNSCGYAIVDLFYDSLKMFFNHKVKPWDPELQHVYTNPNKPVSPTLRTYWFLHILIFGGQIPSFIPSFYEKFYDPEENKSAVEKEKNINLIVDDILSKSAEGRVGVNMDEILKNNDIPQVKGGEGDMNETLEELANEEKILRERINKLKKDPKPDQKYIHEMEDKLQDNTKKRNATIKAADAAKKAEENEAVQNEAKEKADKKAKNVKMAVSGVTAAASGVTSIASGFLSGAKNNITSIIRFMISHYFVTIAAISIAFYLIFYSFFGMIHFSKIGLFNTMFDIDDYIQKGTMDDYRKRCGIEAECSDSWFDWIYDKLAFVYHSAIQTIFKHLYIGTIVAVLLAGVTNLSKIMTSSNKIRLSFKFIFVFFALFITIIYAFKKLIIDAFKGTSNDSTVVLPKKQNQPVFYPIQPINKNGTTVNTIKETIVEKISVPGKPAVPVPGKPAPPEIPPVAAVKPVAVAVKPAAAVVPVAVKPVAAVKPAVVPVAVPGKPAPL